MKDNNKFFKIIHSIKVAQYPIKMNKKQWIELAKFILRFVLETGDFTNTHLCWQASLTEILKKISTKKEKKSFTIKLSPAEFYALLELLTVVKIADSYLYAIVIKTIYELDQAKFKTEVYKNFLL